MEVFEKIRLKMVRLKLNNFKFRTMHKLWNLVIFPAIDNNSAITKSEIFNKSDRSD